MVLSVDTLVTPNRTKIPRAIWLQTERKERNLMIYSLYISHLYYGYYYQKEVSSTRMHSVYDNCYQI